MKSPASPFQTVVFWTIALLLQVGCSTNRVQPTYAVDYPFTGDSITDPTNMATVRIVEVKRKGLAPMSITGTFYLKVELLHSEAANQPGLKSFWIAVPDYPETSMHCVKGRELTLFFDNMGRLVRVKEFADAAQRQIEAFPGAILKP